MILLFIMFAIAVASAWCGHRRIAIALFIIFLIATAFVFKHHVTDHLAIQL